MPAPTGAPLERPVLAQPPALNRASRELFLGFEPPGGRARVSRLRLRGDREFRIELGLDGTDRPMLKLGGGLQATADLRIYREAAATLDIDANSKAVALELRVIATSGQANGISAFVAGDTLQRVQFRGDASMVGVQYSPGATAFDVRQRRTAAGVLVHDTNGVASDTDFRVDGTSGRLVRLNLRVNAEANARAELRGDATVAGILFGPGSSTALDTRMYRSAAKELTFDDGAAAALTAINIIGAAPIEFGGDSRLARTAAKTLSFTDSSGAALTAIRFVGAVSIEFGGDVGLSRTAANVLRIASGDTLDLQLGSLIVEADFMETGTGSLSMGGAATATQAVSFGHTFSATPIVVLNRADNSAPKVELGAINASTTGFTAFGGTGDGTTSSATIGFAWVAFNPNDWV